MAKQTSATSAIDPEELDRRVGSDARRVAEVLALFGVSVKVETGICQVLLGMSE